MGVVMNQCKKQKMHMEVYLDDPRLVRRSSAGCNKKCGEPSDRGLAKGHAALVKLIKILVSTSTVHPCDENRQIMSSIWSTPIYNRRYTSNGFPYIKKSNSMESIICHLHEVQDMVHRYSCILIAVYLRVHEPPFGLVSIPGLDMAPSL